MEPSGSLVEAITRIIIDNREAMIPENLKALHCFQPPLKAREINL